MTVNDLNSSDRLSFAEQIGWVFEHSPWVAEQAWEARPFRDIDALHLAMVQQVKKGGYEKQLALLRAHPDLGTRAKLSHASTTEQAGAGLDQLTPGELERFTKLNDSYRQKFGFPFLLAVKGSTKHQIVNALEQRLPSEPEEEFAEALKQVYRIAAFRLHDVIST